MNHFDEQKAIQIHASKQFKWDSLGRLTRRALKDSKVQVPLSAAGAIGGLTVREADNILDSISPPLSANERMSVKGDLSSKGVLFSANAYRM